MSQFIILSIYERASHFTSKRLYTTLHDQHITEDIQTLDSSIPQFTAHGGFTFAHYEYLI